MTLLYDTLVSGATAGGIGEKKKPSHGKRDGGEHQAPFMMWSASRW